MTKVALKSVRKRHNSGKIILWILVGFAVLMFIIGISNENSQRKSYLKELRVCRAIVEYKEAGTEDGTNNKYYVRIRPTDNAPSEYINSENLTMEVKPEFYSAHEINSDIGVLLGNYDVFKKKAFGRGQTFEKSEWGIEEIYDSFESANAANPVKKVISKALISKKKTTKDGKTFFAVKTEERTMPAEVSKELFDKYSVNQEISCEFEVMGDSIKFLRVVE